MSNFYLCNSAALELNLSKMAFKVYSFLAAAANNKTRSCFHSKSTIAKHCNVSISSVIRATKELCDKGLLRIKRRFCINGRQTSNTYVLLDNPQCTMNDSSSNKASKESQEKVPTNDKKGVSAHSQGKVRLFACPSSLLQLKLSAIELKVYSYLLYRARENKSCRPSKKNIAAACNISVSTVFRATKKLAECGLLEIRRLTRKDVYGNNGTSVNLYIIKTPNQPTFSNSSWFIWILCAFLSCLTPSPMSWLTPQGTRDRTKVTYNLRDIKISSKVVKRYIVHNHTFHASHRKSSAKRTHNKNSHSLKSLSVFNLDNHQRVCALVAQAVEFNPQ